MLVYAIAMLHFLLAEEICEKLLIVLDIVTHICFFRIYEHISLQLN